ncbi:MAG TPA: class I SAM-dependent DNA methyltransferase [Candidatus Binataceae bacterium]|nr:class I SAM-dependent DNA methyltransferase [Candidatus Binataceae bacterium]
MAADIAEIEHRLWRTADQLRANSGLRPSEYSRPVLGLLFLRYADAIFAKAETALKPKPGSRLKPDADAFKARGVLYLPPEARFSYLRDLPERANLGRALNNAMRDIEKVNPELADTLPRNYEQVPNNILLELIKLLDPVDLEGDAFGKVYEFMMGEFAMQEMQKGGEFYTPAAIVRLIVEIIEPYHGRILDPACGSGGMFVHSANFVREHKHEPGKELSLFGIEKTRETLRLAKMNLAIHGLSGEIKEANSYYEDPFDCVGKFDFVMANPPFNVNDVDKGRLAKDKRFPFVLPTPDNANYIWIELFYSALGPKGRAGFVMANSAGDARGSELEIRKKMIEGGAVDVIVSVGPNFFYTVTLPCTLWFFDKGKAKGPRADEVLFIDARRIFRQIDGAHRDFEPWQIEFLANIVHLWRGSETFFDEGSKPEIEKNFPKGKYQDMPGLCRRATRKEIAAQRWSLNPGRYVGIAPGEPDDVDFRERLEELQEELEKLTAEAAALQARIAQNVAELLE